MEQGPDLKAPVPLPAISTTENTRQNGNNDSDQYSDNEEGKTRMELAWEQFKLYMSDASSRNNLRMYDLAVGGGCKILLWTMSVMYLIMQYQHSDPGACYGKGNLLLLTWSLFSIFPRLDGACKSNRQENSVLGVTMFFALHT